MFPTYIIRLEVKQDGNVSVLDSQGVQRSVMLQPPTITESSTEESTEGSADLPTEESTDLSIEGSIDLSGGTEGISGDLTGDSVDVSSMQWFKVRISF